MSQSPYQPFVTFQRNATPYEAEPGVMFTELVREEDGARTMLVGLVTFEPGASLPCHNHNVEETITILSGEADCVVEGRDEPIRVGPHDASFIPPGVAHRFINISTTEKLVIHYVYTQVDENLKPVDAVERNLVDTGRCCA